MIDIKIGADNAISSTYTNIESTLVDSMEEFGELISACTKLLRASKIAGSITPVTKEEAKDHLIEELTDSYASLRLICNVLGIDHNDIERITLEKQNRFADRLEARGSKENDMSDIRVADRIRREISDYEALIKPEIDKLRENIEAI